MNDNVDVDPADPRCLHPSSQCRFRESCFVVAKVREIARRAGEDAPPTPVPPLQEGDERA